MRSRYKVPVLVFSIFFGLVGVLHAANNFAKALPKAVQPIPAPSATLRVGERLVYEVYWMGIPIGTGELQVRERLMLEGHEAIHVVAIAKTNDFLSKIYPVNDEVHSYLDVETLHSLRFEKKLSEGRYHANERIRFDWPDKKVLFESFLNGEHKEYDLEGVPHDFLSCFYWFRTQKIGPGETVKTWVSDQARGWDVEIHVLRRETKELRGKHVVDTLLVEPKSRLKGMLYDRGRAWVYFSTDPTRVPVWVLFKTPFGPVSGILQNFE